MNEVAASGQRDPHDGVLLEYAHPLTGGPTMPTIGCWVQMIPPGEATKPHRHTSSTIYHVVQGDGATIAEKKGAGKESTGAPTTASSCRPGTGTHFENKSTNEPAIIFSVTDRPVLESLGLFREEAA